MASFLSRAAFRLECPWAAGVEPGAKLRALLSELPVRLNGSSLSYWSGAAQNQERVNHELTMDPPWVHFASTMGQP